MRVKDLVVGEEYSVGGVKYRKGWPCILLSTELYSNFRGEISKAREGAVPGKSSGSYSGAHGVGFLVATIDWHPSDEKKTHDQTMARLRSFTLPTEDKFFAPPGIRLHVVQSIEIRETYAAHEKRIEDERLADERQRSIQMATVAAERADMQELNNALDSLVPKGSVRRRTSYDVVIGIDTLRKLIKLAREVSK